MQYQDYRPAHTIYGPDTLEDIKRYKKKEVKNVTEIIKYHIDRYEYTKYKIEPYYKHYKKNEKYCTILIPYLREEGWFIPLGFIYTNEPLEKQEYDKEGLPISENLE